MKQDDLTKMEALRRRLSDLVAENVSLSDPRVVQISEELDALVMKQMRRDDRSQKQRNNKGK